MTQPLSAVTARIAQGLWFVPAVAGAVLSVVIAVSDWKALVTTCHSTAKCNNGQLNTSAAHTLSHLGVSINAFAAYTTAANLAIPTLFYGMGALVIWRKPHDRGAVLTAFFLVTFPLSFYLSLPGVFAALTLFGLLFPNGRFVRKWTRYVGLAAVVACLGGLFDYGPATAATFITVATVPVLQIYRFRSMSSWAERQRIKWALFGLVSAILGVVALILSLGFAPWQTTTGSLYAAIVVPTGFVIAICAIPITLAVSVLRSRLWDIDRVISRALAYTSLSLVLAAIYIGGVIGFQRLFQIFAGSGSPIAIALSTLVIAALFGPLRHRIQSTIDRRFYRAKYDGTRAVTAFSQRLRGELDLAQLSQDMTSVVRETLHPEHVSLWLRETERGELAIPKMALQTTAGDTP